MDEIFPLICPGWCACPCVYGLHKKMKQTSLFVNSISFFQLFIGKWKIFRSWEMIFGDYAKGWSQLWHRGVRDIRLALAQKGWWTRKSRRKFHIFKRISSSLFPKMSVGCLYTLLPYLSTTLDTCQVTRRTLKFTSNSKLPNFSEKQKLFTSFFGRSTRKEKKWMRKKIINKLFFASLFSSFSRTRKRRRNLWSRACLCPFYCLFWFFSHCFDTNF